MGGLPYTAQEIVNMLAWRREGYTHAQIGRRTNRGKQASSYLVTKVNASETEYNTGETRIDLTGLTPEPFRKPYTKRRQDAVITAAVSTVRPVSKTNEITEILTSNLTRETKLKVLSALI